MFMLIDQRDLTITRLVFEFQQLTSQHIQRLVFPNHSSHTPASRSLNRLVARRYLYKVERRLVGGAKGGSGQYVYCLGAEGHRLFSESRWSPARAVHPHTLAIADVYVALYGLERDNKLLIRGHMTEPDCHLEVGRYSLKPDLYMELSRPGSDNVLPVMFEIDMGTQGQRQITEKFQRYWQASQVGEPWPNGGLVVFVAVDDDRAKHLRWLLERGSKEQRELFRIRTLANVGEAFSAA